MEAELEETPTMSIENPQYDVALSFLFRDEATARAIYDKLSEGLKVFFFPRNQEELAGTDGLETMRTPFFSDSRVMVVLYREPWGKTPWTRVEEIAIKESRLEHGWQRLFFISLDRESPIPIWLPQNLVRFNYADFGLEQAIGAIKARVQEHGGQQLPMTAIKRAQILQAEEIFRQDKSQLSSDHGLKAIVEKVDELFKQIEKRCSEVNAQSPIDIRCGVKFQERSAIQSCGITNGRVGMLITWYQPFSSTLTNCGLVIKEYHGGILLPSEIGRSYAIDRPRELVATKYLPDLSLAREVGWTKEGEASNFLSSSALAEKCVIGFIDLVSRHGRGEFRYSD
jgi:hypothetical protein